METVNKTVLGNYIVDLYSAETPEAEFKITSDYISKLGFDGLLYCYIPSLVIDKKLDVEPVFNVSDTYSKNFLDHYEQAGFGEHDFTLKRICDGFEGTIDWWEEAQQESITSDERSVIEVAREDYGIANGITLSTMVDNTGFAGGSFISESTSLHFDLLKKDSLETAKIILQAYHNKVLSSPESRKTYILPLLDRLNQTDRKILHYLIKHKTMSRVEDVTGVSTYYANRVVERLRSKLGGITRSELIYYTGLLNLLELVD